MLSAPSCKVSATAFPDFTLNGYFCTPIICPTFLSTKYLSINSARPDCAGCLHKSNGPFISEEGEVKSKTMFLPPGVKQRNHIEWRPLALAQPVE